MKHDLKYSCSFSRKTEIVFCDSQNNFDVMKKNQPKIRIMKYVKLRDVGKGKNIIKISFFTF